MTATPHTLATAVRSALAHHPHLRTWPRSDVDILARRLSETEGALRAILAHEQAMGRSGSFAATVAGDALNGGGAVAP